MSRAAIEQLMKFMAVRLGPQGVRCNCILPTKIIKPENKKFYNQEDNLSRNIIEKITPLNRMGRAEDIANLVKFLTSDQSNFITGVTIPVDGGASLFSQESVALKFTNEK